MDEYWSDPRRWPKIRGILPAGTRIRLERIEHRTFPGLEVWYEATGLIESGEFRGRNVNLVGISSRVGATRMFRVNPADLGLESLYQ